MNSGPPPHGRQPPPPPPPPRPGIGETYLRAEGRTPLDQVRSPYGLVIALLSTLIFSTPNLLVVFTGDLAPSDPRTLPEGPELIVGLVISLVLLVIVFLLSVLPLLVAGRPYRRLFGPTRPDGLMWAVGIGTGIVTMIVTYAVNAFFVLSFGGGEGAEQQALLIVRSGGLAMALSILLAVVIAPVVEEVVFRGVLFRALAERLGLWAAALVSAVVFALVHVEVVYSQPFALPGLFAVGFLLAVAYHRTGTLLVPIVGHAVFNGMAVMLVLLGDQLGVA